MDAYLSSAGDYMQMIEMADDIGIQIEPVISPKLYEKIILPYYKELLNLVKSKALLVMWTILRMTVSLPPILA